MLKHAEAMLSSHPQPMPVNRTVLLECLEALHACALACASCADACLAERDVQNLVGCIRLDQDCADICEVTARLLTRHSAPHSPILRRQLAACEAACQACGAECEKHAHHHEHCQVCAEACRACAEACHAALQQVPAEAIPAR